jgi:hypothetical protein
MSPLIVAQRQSDARHRRARPQLSHYVKTQEQDDMLEDLLNHSIIPKPGVESRPSSKARTLGSNAVHPNASNVQGCTADYVQ